MTCAICNKYLEQSKVNDVLYNGFQCKDTGLFVHWTCRRDFYHNKNYGLYGTQHIHKYAEFPVPIKNDSNNTPTDTNNVLASCFLAMFENGNYPFYLAIWEGDPGRTLLKSNAKQFRTQALAEKAIKKAMKDYPHRNLVGKVVEYNDRNTHEL